VLDLLLPQRCVVCSRAGGQVCDACTSALRRLGPPACARCGAPSAWPVRECVECAGRRVTFVRARAAVEYDSLVRRIVGAWKERGLRGLAAWAAAVVADTVERPEASLTFVPADAERRLQRGHHPAEALARELSRTWGLGLEPLLVRARGSPRRQRELTRAQRRGNVAAAFAAGGRVVPSRVVLVDDVYTTGSTASAAAAALRKAGCGEVEVVTFARTIRIR
jgi:predicted amidophosphoribosyltransferase